MRVVVLGPSHHPVAEPFAGGQERFADLVVADRLHVMPELPLLSCVASSDPNVPEERFLNDRFVNLAAVRDLLRRNDIDAILNASLVAS